MPWPSALLIARENIPGLPSVQITLLLFTGKLEILHPFTGSINVFCEKLPNGYGLCLDYGAHHRGSIGVFYVAIWTFKKLDV